MDALFEILPILFIVLVAVISGKGKKGKQTKASTPAQTRKPANTRKPASARSIGRTIAAEMKKEKPATTVPVSQGEDPCHEYMLGPRGEQMEYHPTTEADLQEAGEGEDPCHVGHAAESQTESAYEIISADRSEIQRAFSEGIIMAEILKRPSERRRERPRYRYGKAANE